MKFVPKVIILFCIIVFALNNSMAQKNQTPDDGYISKEGNVEMGKATYRSDWMKGYVILTNGNKRIDGPLSLKKAGEDVKKVSIKVNGKVANYKVKDVKEFGLTQTVSNAKLSEEIAKKMTKKAPGVIYLDEKEMSGQLDMQKFRKNPRTIKENENGYDGYDRVIIHLDEGGYHEFKPDSPVRILVKKQTNVSGIYTDGVIKEKVNKDTWYISRDGFFVTLEYESENLLVRRNPVPKTIIKSWSVANDKFFKGNYYSQAIEAKRRELDAMYQIDYDFASFCRSANYSQLVEKFQKMERISEGKPSKKMVLLDWCIVVKGIEEDQFNQFKDEWILEFKNSDKSVMIYKGNFKEQLGPLLDKCPAYVALPRNEKSQLLNWNEWEETIEVLSTCQ